jgi:hypothetical protein
MYHHVTKAIEKVATYHQVRDIINEHVNDRKGYFVKE